MSVDHFSLRIEPQNWCSLNWVLAKKIWNELIFNHHPFYTLFKHFDRKVDPFMRHALCVVATLYLNGQVTVRWLSGDCQVTVRWPSGDCQATVRWLSGDCQATVRRLSGDCQATVRRRSVDCQATVRWPSRSLIDHYIVFPQTQEEPLIACFTSL